MSSVLGFIYSSVSILHILLRILLFLEKKKKRDMQNRLNSACSLSSMRIIRSRVAADIFDCSVPRVHHEHYRDFFFHNPPTENYLRNLLKFIFRLSIKSTCGSSTIKNWYWLIYLKTNIISLNSIPSPKEPFLLRMPLSSKHTYVYIEMNAVFSGMHWIFFSFLFETQVGMGSCH